MLTLAAALFLGGCITPVNLNFESASMLETGGVEMQGSASTYHAASGANTANNAGFKLGYGISESYNLKFRYELLMLEPYHYDNNAGRNNGNSAFVFDQSYHYLEIDQKIRLSNNLAVSVPVGVYLGGWPVFSIDPRMYCTFSRSDQFELNLVPKCHLLLYAGGFPGIMPALSMGLGFSKDLKRWAIRPEIGYDRFLSFGIGFSYYLPAAAPLR